MGYLGMCGPKRYGFQPFGSLNRVTISAILVITRAEF